MLHKALVTLSDLVIIITYNYKHKCLSPKTWWIITIACSVIDSHLDYYNVELYLTILTILRRLILMYHPMQSSVISISHEGNEHFPSNLIPFYSRLFPRTIWLHICNTRLLLVVLRNTKLDLMSIALYCPDRTMEVTTNMFSWLLWGHN